MRPERLTLALGTGALVLPETGRIAVYRPRAGDDLAPLGRERVQVVTGFRPDHDAFLAAGYASARSAGPVHAALVCLPRSKPEARALLAQACVDVAPGGVIVVDGQKTDGIESVHRDVQARTAVSVAVSKAHGKLFTFTASDALADWAAAPVQVEGGFVTRPGVFSADGPDPGSALLAASLPEKLGSRVIDLGAGWGHLSRAVLTRPGVQSLDLVEAEADALDCARLNVTDPRAQFHWADALAWKGERGADAVVCNPPFHTGREANPGLGLAFIAAAAHNLAPHGTLWLVANRHLPYQAALATLFREVTDLAGSPAFRVIRASRPNRPR